MTDDELREELAAIEHQRWSHWQSYMHGLCTKNEDGSLTIPPALVERWSKQIATPYEELSESEQASDREQVERYWHLVMPVLDADQMESIGRMARITRKMAPMLGVIGLDVSAQAGLLFDASRIERILEVAINHGAKEPH